MPMVAKKSVFCPENPLAEEAVRHAGESQGGVSAPRGISGRESPEPVCGKGVKGLDTAERECAKPVSKPSMSLGIEETLMETRAGEVYQKSRP